MGKHDHLEQHIKLCQEVYERLKREGTWPWSDSQESEDVLESDNNSDNA